MPSFLTALRTGVSAGLGSFKRVYQSPAQPTGGALLNQWSYLNLLYSYYDNSAFQNLALWTPYRSAYRLYRQMRLIYNPTRRLCDFYGQHIYPGLLTADESNLPDGTSLALPLATETTPQMRAGLDQLWAWSRWQVNKNVLCRYGAIAGSVLLEVVDNPGAGQVYLDVVWAGLVSYLDLDPTGTIKAYALQYPARGDDGNYYEYRKEVTTDTISYYKDGRPFDYGEGASYPNPYGVVPAVWIKHKDLGNNNGEPAIHGSLDKIDELNSLASHIHDQVHKVIGAPLVLWSDGGVANLFGGTGQTKGPATNPYDPSDLDREGLLLLKGPGGGRVDHLAGDVQLHEAAEHLQLLLTEIEQDHPEVTMYRQLRTMSQVTGPAAARLMGDVVANVDEAAANYDAGSVQAFALALGIAGWRAARGDWGPLSAAQQLMTPFSLEAYHAGDLTVRVLPRPLIPISELESLAIQQMKDSMKTGATATLTANLREAIPE